MNNNNNTNNNNNNIINTTTTSKPKFRSRKLDYKKPLPIFQSADLPDLDDEAHRAVPVVATGVEKEEEEEHHLQAVISASQVQNDPSTNTTNTNNTNKTTTTNTTNTNTIPTPDASSIIGYYSELYKKHFISPTSYIRYSNTIQDSSGPIYCMDESDIHWLNSLNTTTTTTTLNEYEFELVFSELERLTDEQQAQNPEYFATISDLDAFILLESPSKQLVNAIPLIHEYWLQKRLQTNNGRSIIPKLKCDEATKGELDPYICFRKREVRTTRKTRRADAQSIQKLRQLRADMETAKVMMEMVTKREKMRSELLILEEGIFKQKIDIKETRTLLNIPDTLYEETRLARKRAAKIRLSGTNNNNNNNILNNSNNVSILTSSTGRSLKNTTTTTTATTKKRANSQTDDEYAYKDPILLGIENEVVSYRMLQNSQWEDYTETGISMPFESASAFFTNVEHSLNDGIHEMNEKWGVQDCRIRRRVGRGGRVLFDRYPQKSPFKYDTALNPPSSLSLIY